MNSTKIGSLSNAESSSVLDGMKICSLSPSPIGRGLSGRRSDEGLDLEFLHISQVKKHQPPDNR
ncbi:hypothetical protein EMIT0347P_20309 [Pseudomonas sp. IT-347P]